MNKSVLPLLLVAASAIHAAESLLPSGWDPALAGDEVMERLVKVTAARAKGAHDAEMVLLGDRAYIVEHDNDIQPGHGAGRHMYCVLSVVNLGTLAVEAVIPLAKSAEVFANVTLPVGACFVPRILQVNDRTLRCFFASEDGSNYEAQTWYRDFDIGTQSFESRIHQVKLKTAAGVFDMQPKHFYADAVAQGFRKPAKSFGLYLFDSFKQFDGRIYVALNNFPGKQNALARMGEDFATFEVIGHYNEPQELQLSESAVNRLPDGTWMAICRQDGGNGNYTFTTSRDGRTWTRGEHRDFVPNGWNSKPTFDKFGDVYYLGWQEATRIQNVNRSVFNVDISRDGKGWERKYRFESIHSFQYPSFHEHQGSIWVCVTQGTGGSTDRIMFGKLEASGGFASQSGRKRQPPPPAHPETAPLMKRGARLFSDRDYVIEELPEALRDLPFLHTSITRVDAECLNPGILYALTPTARPKAASQETALREAGFEKVPVPEVSLFPGEINRVSLYSKKVARGDRFHFQKLVLLVAGPGVEIKPVAPSTLSLEGPPGAPTPAGEPRPRFKP